MRFASIIAIAMAPPKNNGEKQITVGQRKATTKAREQGKRNQLPQA